MLFHSFLFKFYAVTGGDQGMRDAGMAATAKHFPGHGAVVADSHLALPVDRREFSDLADDLTPYRRLIDNGLPAVMVARLPEDPGPYFKLYPEGHIANFDGRTIPAPYFLSDNLYDFNRNFPYDWAPEPTQAGAGHYPGSAPETRAASILKPSTPSGGSLADGGVSLDRWALGSRIG